MKSILILLFIIAIGCGHYVEKDSTIKIKCQNCANQIVVQERSFYMKEDTIKFDSIGEASINISIEKQKQFITVGIPHIQQWFTVFMEPGFDVVLNLDDSIQYFSGKGAALNNYLFYAKKGYNPLYDSVYSIMDPHKEFDNFIKLTKDFEHAQLNLYKQYRDSIVPDMETDYLLRGNIQSAILRAKQEFLSNFETKEIDSLNLINKLGLDINNLLDDTILIKHPSFNLYMYLNAYQNMHIDSRVSHNDDFNSYMRSAVNLIDTEKKYSKEIKSHLLSNLIYHFMMVAGPTPLTDSITDQLSARKKISIDGINALTDIRKEYEHLMPGKPAPYLQGISTDGRVIAISDFKGKVVFVDIWATWCKPCIEALPHILKLQNSFKNNNEVLFIFLSNDSRENGDENWKKYLEAHPEFKGQHLRARKEEDRPLEEAWKVTGIPRYMLIDKKGNIIDAFVKNHSFEEIQLMIERALLEQ